MLIAEAGDLSIVFAVEMRELLTARMAGGELEKWEEVPFKIAGSLPGNLPPRHREPRGDAVWSLQADGSRVEGREFIHFARQVL